MQPISRRSAIQTILLGSGVLYLQSCTKLLSGNPLFSSQGSLGDIGPIDRTLKDVAPRVYYGDEMFRGHSALWNIRKNALPAPSEKASVVVIGAGMSGLSTAYLLRHRDPIVLEHSSRVGGNSRAQSWNGSDYSIGACYFLEPDKGSPLEKFYEEIGVMGLAKKVTDEDSYLLDGKLGSELWSGKLDPKNKKQFVRLKAYFESVYNETQGRVFPEIPFEDSKMEAYVKKLDRQNFLQHVEQVVKGPLNPYLRSLLEHYCWSSFGGAMTELSAASGLNFYAAEFGGVYVMPGGNAGVAEQMYNKLASQLPKNNIRAKSTVVNVKVVSDGVVVTYLDPQEKFRAIHAKAAVMACPKFVVKNTLEGIEEDRKSAIQKMQYRGYLIANILLKKQMKLNFYDSYILNPKEKDYADMEGAANRQGATDVVNGTYAQASPTQSILTLYRGMPFDGGRQQMFQASSYDKFRKEFEDQAVKEILPALGFTKEDIVDVRISRLGHAHPVAQKGKISDGTAEKIRSPFQGKVFFVEQDNWMLPAIETSIQESLYWKDKIEAVLG